MSRARLLLITPEGDISAEFELQDSNIVIGRSPQSDIVIADSDVSRSHSQIVETTAGFFVSDMDSTNGTYLNGVPLQPKQMFELKSNDQINLGRISLLFQLVSTAIPKVSNNATVRFRNNDSQTMLKSLERTIGAAPKVQSALMREIPQPIYIPQAEHLNIELAFDEEELNLAKELFTENSSVKSKSAWASWNIFQPKAKISLNNFEPEEWPEEELAEEILGQNNSQAPIQEIPKDNYPVLYKAKPAPKTNPEMAQLAYSATTQTMPQSYIIDTESFYYPQVHSEQDTKKFAPENYSYNTESALNGRDPFADLNFRDEDSFLAKFNNHQQKPKNKNPQAIISPDLKNTFQQFAIPFALVASAGLIAFAVHFTNSGVFG